MDGSQPEKTQTAKEAGWRQSRYNLSAQLPGTNKTVIVNLFRGTCAVYSPVELYLLHELPTLDETHPIIERFSKRGLIVNFDELEALKLYGHTASAGLRPVSLTICPTMACNFDCPYCYENHSTGKMSQAVQDDVVALARRMLHTFPAKLLKITWFGGEPLLAPDVIEQLSQQLITLASEQGAAYQAQIITNGYLLTQPLADLLHRCKVRSAQITLDGIGSAHDATRHLADGRPTFQRIACNLRQLNLPFTTILRQNVHQDNINQVEPLKQWVRKLAEESGNRLYYYPAPLHQTTTSHPCSTPAKLLHRSASIHVSLQKDVESFAKGRGHYCGANLLSELCVDQQGRLHKCQTDVDKPQQSFGTAAKWDPASPIQTADNPDRLTCYINALPFNQPQCLSCIWLPACAGGCPNTTLFQGKPNCLPYKDVPEQYVMALYKHMQQSVKI
ncbi:MAG: radical SAM protein [Bacteroidaceae bacterium]|nr:radical SAM protein [Bacteroidaceae bacterium]